VTPTAETIPNKLGLVTYGELRRPFASLPSAKYMDDALQLPHTLDVLYLDRETG
jgi:hypothetical protein